LKRFFPDRIQCAEHKEIIHRNHGCRRRSSDGRRREEFFAPVNQYRNMVDAFAESVLNKQPVPLPAEDGLNNVKVLEALTRSAPKMPQNKSDQVLTPGPME
jgi:predicted dehydrogenase